MEELGADRYEDVVDFFRKWYGPANASVVIAGDVDSARARRLAEKWFGEIPASARVEPLAPRPVVLESEKRLLLEDRVELPRLYLAWHTPPRYAPAEAALVALGAILSDGKNSRLYKRLVYEMQVAQDVSAFVDSGALGSTFNLIVTARSGRTLEEIRRLVDEEIARVTQDGSDRYEAQASAYVGGYFTPNSDIFTNLDSPSLSIKDVQLTLSGPIPGMDGLRFFGTGRYFKDDGYLYGARVYNVTDDVPYFPIPGDNTVWIPRNTGDGAYVAMNPSERISSNGKVSYSLTSFKVSYSIFYDANENQYYDHYFSWTPDGP